MKLIKKLNPLTILTRAVDAVDAWSWRMGYQGHHWAPA